MKIVHFTSTKLKKDTAEILNLVVYGDTEAIIERHGEPVAKIMPINEVRNNEDLAKKIKRHFGSIPDFPEITRERIFRKRSISL